MSLEISQLKGKNISNKICHPHQLFDVIVPMRFLENKENTSLGGGEGERNYQLYCSVSLQNSLPTNYAKMSLSNVNWIY